MKFTFLGTGGSLGVPLVGCSCDVCKNEVRLRCSGLLEIDGKRFLIDTGPDFRQQALTFGFDQLDGVLLTHTHYDHVAGLDDLRAFAFKSKKPVPVLLSRESHEEVKQCYYYLDERTLTFSVLDDDFGNVVFEGQEFSFVSYMQAGMNVLGFRAQDFAYVTDIQTYDEAIFDHLAGVKRLVLSASTSKLHFSIQDAIAFSKKVNPREVYLTHIPHDISQNEKGLPNHIKLAYDGLVI